MTLSYEEHMTQGYGGTAMLAAGYSPLAFLGALVLGQGLAAEV